MSRKKKLLIAKLRIIIGAVRDRPIEAATCGVFVVLPFVWARGLVIAGGDSFPVADEFWYVKHLAYAWDPTIAPGVPAPAALAVFPLHAFLAAIQTIAGSAFAYTTLQCCFVVGSGLGAYLLATSLHLHRTGRIATALFYVLNPYAMYLIWPGTFGLLQPAYAVAPFVIAVVIAAMRREFEFQTGLIVGTVWALLGAPTYQNPAVAAVAWLAPAAVLVAYLFAAFSWRRLRFAVALTLAWGAASAFWALPYVESLSAVLQRDTASLASSAAQTLRFGSVPYLEAIRLSGYWALNGGFRGQNYFSYGATYSTPLFFVLGCAEFVVFCVGAATCARNGLAWAALLTCTAITLFFLNGVYPPTGHLLLALFSRSTAVATAFRNPVYKFGPELAVCYAPFIGAGFQRIFACKAHALARLGGAILALCLFVVYVFPIWTGAVIGRGGPILPEGRVDVPPYYAAAREWLGEHDAGGALLPLPLSRYTYFAYDWPHGYYGGQVDYDLFDAPVWASNVGTTYEPALPIGLATQYGGEFAQSLSWWLKALNIEYVVLHGDANYRIMQGQTQWFNTSQGKLESFLESAGNLRYRQSFGELSLWRVHGHPNAVSVSSGVSLWRVNFANTQDAFAAIESGPSDAPAVSQGGAAPLVGYRAVLDQGSRAIVVPFTGDFRISVAHAVGAPLAVRLDRDGTALHAALAPRIYENDGGSYTVEVRALPHGAASSVISTFVDGVLLRPGGLLFLTAGMHLLQQGRIARTDAAASLACTNNGSECDYVLPTRRGVAYALSATGRGPTAVDVRVEDPLGASLGHYRTKGETILFVGQGRWTRVRVASLSSGPAPRVAVREVKQYGSHMALVSETAPTTFRPLRMRKGQHIIFKCPPFARRVLRISFNAEDDGTQEVGDGEPGACPGAMLAIIQGSKHGIGGYVPSIQYEAVSPVRYDVKVGAHSRPVLMILAQSYDPNWRVCGGAGRCSLPFRHVRVYGYANGWYLPPGPAEWFTIYYELQDVMLRGLLVSGVTALTAAVAAAVSAAHARRKQRLTN